MAAIPDSSGVIHACYGADGRNPSGDLPVIDTASTAYGAKCQRSEKALNRSYNVDEAPGSSFRAPNDALFTPSFGSWGGDCTSLGTLFRCAVLANSDLVIPANFVIHG